MLQLLVPFVLGHLSRRWIGAWVEKHRNKPPAEWKSDRFCQSDCDVSPPRHQSSGGRDDPASASSLLGVFISPLLVNLVMDVHSNAPSDGLEQIGKINRLDAEALQTAAATLPPAIEVKAMADCTVAGRMPG
jgi:hypothetical protein